MAKPEPASGSLEDILSSIRRSLAEQSTDVLTGDASARGADAKPAPRKEGLVGRLANATAGIVSPSDRATDDDDLADMLVTAEPSKTVVPEPDVVPAPAIVEPPVAEPKAAVAASTEPAPPSDPLWFLTRSVEASAPKEPEKPSLTRPEEARASMPPFFGASTETIRVDAPPAVEAPPPSRPLFGTANGPAIKDPAIEREVSLVAAAAETAARPGPVNGAGEPLAAAAPASTLQGSQALEAMVLELLKPMLREWLDQNMPRMVAEALKAEAGRVGAGENAKKP